MDKEITNTIYKCKFNLLVGQVYANIDNPCLVFVQWKQDSNQNSKFTSQKIKPQNNMISFHQTIQVQYLIIFDEQLQQFTKKQTSIFVNFITEANTVKTFETIILDLSQVLKDQKKYQSQKFVFSDNQSYLTIQLSLISKEIVENIKQFQQQLQDTKMYQKRECLNPKQAELIYKINELAVENNNSQIVNELQKQIEERDEILNDYDNKIDQNIRLKDQVCSVKTIIQQLSSLLNERNIKIQELNKELQSKKNIGLQSFESQIQQKYLENESLQNSIYQLNEIIKKVNEEKINKCRQKDQQILQLRNQINVLNQQKQQKIMYLQIVEDREVKLIQRQLKIRENLAILEQQSKKILELLIDKQKIQQQQLQKIQSQETTIQQLLSIKHQLQIQLEQKSKQTNHHQNQQKPISSQQLAELKYQIQQLITQNQEITLSKVNLQMLLQKQQSQKISISGQRQLLKVQNQVKLKIISQLDTQLKNLAQQHNRILQSKIILQRKLLEDPQIYNQTKQLSMLQTLVNQKDKEIYFLKNQIMLKDKNLQALYQLNENIILKDQQIKRLQLDIQLINFNHNAKIQNIDELREENTSIKQQIMNLQNKIIELNLKINQQNEIQKPNFSNSQQKIQQITQQYQQFKKISKLNEQQLKNQIQNTKKQLSKTLQLLDQSQKQNIQLKTALDNRQNNKIQRNQELDLIQKVNIQLQIVQNCKNEAIQLKNELISLSNEQIKQSQDQKLITAAQINTKSQNLIKFYDIVNSIKILLDNREKQSQRDVISSNFGANKQLTKDKIKDKMQILLMEFTKIKSVILKNIINGKQRILLLLAIKPLQKIAKQIFQIYSANKII